VSPDTKAHEYHTTFAWAACALFLAAALIAGLTAAYYLFNIYISVKPEVFRQQALGKALMAFLIAFAIWLCGLLIFGAPVWRMMHLSGRRKWYHAAVAGFAVPFTVILAYTTGFFTGQADGQWSSFANGGQQWVDGTITRFGLFIAFRTASVFGLVGACVGLFIWKVAYRRRPGPSATCA
jgi:MFS family permease